MFQILGIDFNFFSTTTPTSSSAFPSMLICRLILTIACHCFLGLLSLSFYVLLR